MDDIKFFAIIGNLDNLMEDCPTEEAEVLALLDEVAAKYGAEIHIDRQPGHEPAIEVTAPSRQAIIDIGCDLHYQFGGHDAFNEEDFLDYIGEIEEM